MPLTKQRKEELVQQYAGWLKKSSAVIVADYSGVATNDLNKLRIQVDEADGEIHVIKRTLFMLALNEAGLTLPEESMAGAVLMAFAQEDPPAVAKALMDFAKDFEEFGVLGGLLDSKSIDLATIQALAELPPRPIILSQLIATVEGPLSQLVKVLNAPMREIAQVLHARSEEAQMEASA